MEQSVSTQCTIKINNRWCKKSPHSSLKHINCRNYLLMLMKAILNRWFSQGVRLSLCCNFFVRSAFLSINASFYLYKHFLQDESNHSNWKYELQCTYDKTTTFIVIFSYRNRLVTYPFCIVVIEIQIMWIGYFHLILNCFTML